MSDPNARDSPRAATTGRRSSQRQSLESNRTSSPPPTSTTEALQTRQGSIGSPTSVVSASSHSRLDSEIADRIFPVRSVISVDPTPTPSVRSFEGQEFPGLPPLPSGSPASAPSSDRAASPPNNPNRQRGSDRSESARVPSGLARTSSRVATDAPRVPSTERSLRSGSGAATSSDYSTAPSGPTSDYRGVADDETPEGAVVTARFKHVVTTDGAGVTTDGEGQTVQRCEDEPIHIPGAVQGFGLLIALREEGEGKYEVRIASENARSIIGFTPAELFALDSFCDILSGEQTDNLLDHIDFIRDEDADPAVNGPEVFTISIRPPRRRTIKLWCAMHINKRNPDLIICEFELEDDQRCPLVPPDDSAPAQPEDTLRSEPTPDELAESTSISSKPLRILRSARKRKGEAAAMDVFNIMSQVQEQLASAPSLDRFLKILVGVIKELTGFHRVMVYQFDHAWNGQVVTELVDYHASKDLYKGLHFPASDIPQQARELYKINKVRLLYDRDQETARLVCRTAADLENPLDLTFSYLRAMSPIHITYLANMGVRASMSISINAFNELWGLISCHAYGGHGMRVSFPIRKMCRLIGDAASHNIERLSYASRLQARKLINTAPTAQNPSGYIIASSDDLLQLFGADFGLLSIHDETKILGRLEQTQEALAMLEYLRMRRFTGVMMSQDLREDFPDLRYPPGFQVIAGLLLVPLSTAGEDFIVFFRRGQLKEVRWAGNPYEKMVKEGTQAFLEPRKSFKTWRENVTGKCREWSEEEIETAAVLCLVYGKFITVWRQKEAALQSSQLTRLLLANSAHEVRTPLNAIINYLEIALEGSLDQETRDSLAKSHSASKSLIYVINDLLDLTKTEEGHELTKDDIFSLTQTIREVTDMFRGDAKRKQLEFVLTEHPGVPGLVIGDQRRTQQALSNIIANAIQNTVTGGVTVECWVAHREGRRVDVEIAVQDTGAGMAASKLDALFRELEQVQTEANHSLTDSLSGERREPTAAEASTEPRPQQPAEQRPLGLGLAVVARNIRNMDGQLRLKSEEGKGSRFVIQIPFEIPPGSGPGEPGAPLTPSNMDPPSGPVTPMATEGEVFLVQNAPVHRTSHGGSTVARKQSVDSMHSHHSFESQRSTKSGKSNKSDVDRLIDAISEPHMVPKTSTTDAVTRAGRGSVSHPNRPPMSRSASYGGEPLVMTPEHLRSPQQLKPGEEIITDSISPLRPVRMPDDSTALPDRVAIEAPQRVARRIEEVAEAPSVRPLRVLVAEDDPINSRIIKKRLEKIGHRVQLTVNGEECASMYGEQAEGFDVVLMDMQMPIVDGLTSTKRIRAFESSVPPAAPAGGIRPRPRVPIFAVSASLVEKNRGLYREAGFDGWILKPIDFPRFNTLLAGIVEPDKRAAARYQPGAWERGGWFT